MHESQPVGTVSRRTAIAGLGAGAIGVGLVRGSQGVLAQESPSEGDPIVGAWQWNSYPGAEEPATFAIFHADGTYLEWNPGPGAAIGVWRSSGDGAYDLLFLFQDTDPTPEVLGRGTGTFTITLTLAEDGNALDAQGQIDVRDAGGVQLATVPWKRPATRLSFDVNPSTGSIPATPEA